MAPITSGDGVAAKRRKSHKRPLCGGLFLFRVFFLGGVLGFAGFFRGRRTRFRLRDGLSAPIPADDEFAEGHCLLGEQPGLQNPEFALSEVFADVDGGLFVGLMTFMGLDGV